ncbi:hypothetical protein [Virgibacillus sp. 6R]|nr:hypothetical protein [Virgibacillus sp. 6R]
MEKMRKLGIPTVVDRVVQQAISQKLSPETIQRIQLWLPTGKKL